MANPRSIAMAKIREREALARQAAMLNSGSNTTPVANPRLIAMEKLREREALAKQAAMLGAEQKKGVMSSVPTTLNDIGQFVSDDNNDLDDVSFSTLDGLKASFKNNRGKDSVPKINVSPRDAAMAARKGNYEMQKESTRAVASDDAKRFSALNSFIETNSAPSAQLDANLMNRNTDLAFEAYDRDNELQKQYESSEEFKSLAQDEINRKQYHKDNRKRFQELQELFPNQKLTSKFYPDEDYSSEAIFNQLNKIENSITGTYSSKLDTKALMGLDDSLILSDIDNRANIANEKRLQNIQFNATTSDDIAVPSGPMTVEEYDEILANEEDYVDPDNVDIYGQTTTEPLFELFTDTPNSIEGTNFTEQNKASDQKLFEMAEEQELLNSMTNLNQSLDGNNEITASSDLSLDIDEVIANQNNSNLSDIKVSPLSSEDELMITNEADGDSEADEIAQSMDDTVDIDQGFVQTDAANLDQSLDGSNYDELLKQEVAQVEETAIIETSAKELDSTEESAVAKTQADAVVTDVESGAITSEEGEAKLSNIFGSLKDIFGIDNNSLIRAFVKYAGGRMFGMSSGRAAGFAWKGIEADMASNTAKGAKAKEYANNMAEFETQYDAAMDEMMDDGSKGNSAEANRILSAMNKLSGVDKSDPEIFNDGIDYLNKKYKEAEKDQDIKKMEQIAKQLEVFEAAGVGGVSSDTWMGSLSMEDENGVKKVAQAMQQSGQPLKYYDQSDKTWKLPSDGGFKNAVRTATSDSSTDFGASDERVRTKEDEAYTEATGRTYKTTIPGASKVTDYGVPLIPEENSTMGDRAVFAKNSVASLMQMQDMIKDPRVRAEVFSLKEDFYNNTGKNIAEQGNVRQAFSKYIAQNGSPVAKIWFNNMSTLITSKLRRETGAAYNKDELAETMAFFPNATLWPSNYEELNDRQQQDVDDLVDARVLASRDWILGDAQSLNAHEYLEGLIMGDFKPNDLWIETNKANKKVIRNSYPSNETTDFINNGG